MPSTDRAAYAAPPILATPDQALPILQRHGDNASAFLGLNAGNRYFTAPGLPGMVMYRPFGRRYWLQFTGACAPPDRRGELDAAFAAAGRRAGRRVLGVQLDAEDAGRAAAAGCVVTRFGTSYSIDLADFTLRGQKFVKTRNMIARSRREGVRVTELGPEQAADPACTARLDAVDAVWLRHKGRHVKELRFMIGERGGPLQDRRRLFTAEVDGDTVAYVSYSPVFGSRPGWLYDLTRRAPDAPPGVIEHIFAEAAAALRADGARWLHLGLTPFVGLDPELPDPPASRLLHRMFTAIRDHGAALYPARQQVAFKRKWRPQLETAEYLAIPRRVRPGDLWCLARATNSL